MKRRQTPHTVGARRTVPLRAGTRVRVRQEVDSPLAGRKGIVMYVGDGICDVKVVEKQKGTGHSEITIETLPREALESVRPNVDLVSLPKGSQGVILRRGFVWGTAVAVVVVAAVFIADMIRW